MTPAQISLLLAVADLGVRLLDNPKDVEEYAKLRAEVRREVVAEANSKTEHEEVGLSAPSDQHDTEPDAAELGLPVPPPNQHDTEPEDETSPNSQQDAPVRPDSGADTKHSL